MLVCVSLGMSCRALPCSAGVAVLWEWNVCPAACNCSILSSWRGLVGREVHHSAIQAEGVCLVWLVLAGGLMCAPFDAGILHSWIGGRLFFWGGGGGIQCSRVLAEG